MTSDYDVEAVERDLYTLAHHRAGFQRPERLAETLNVVLDLEVVGDAAGTNRTSRIVRVAALGSVLRTAVDRIRSPVTKTAALIYFYLLSDDELEELDLPHDLWASGLGARRGAIEQLLQYNRGSFRGSHEDRVRTLTAGELVRLEAESARPDAQATTDESRSATPSVELLGVSQAVRQALSRAYRDEHSLIPLSSLVVSDRGAFYDTVVNLALADAEQPGLYTYTLSASFSADIEEYVVGYVTHAYFTDQILALSNKVTDVYSCSDETERDARFNAATDSLDILTRIVTRADGRTLHQPIRLAPVAADEYERYLGTLAPKIGSEVKLLRGGLQNTSGLQRLRTQHKLNLSKADHFCYWVTDRPVFLRQLRIDTRDLFLHDEPRPARVTVQPFSMASSTPVALGIGGVLNLDFENWLVRGQGFVVVW